MKRRTTHEHWHYRVNIENRTVPATSHRRGVQLCVPHDRRYTADEFDVTASGGSRISKRGVGQSTRALSPLPVPSSPSEYIYEKNHLGASGADWGHDPSWPTPLEAPLVQIIAKFGLWGSKMVLILTKNSTEKCWKSSAGCNLRVFCTCMFQSSWRHWRDYNVVKVGSHRIRCEGTFMLSIISTPGLCARIMFVCPSSPSDNSYRTVSSCAAIMHRVNWRIF